jgi:hypothetical protein
MLQSNTTVGNLLIVPLFALQLMALPLLVRVDVAGAQT